MEFFVSLNLTVKKQKQLLHKSTTTLKQKSQKLKVKRILGEKLFTK